MSGFLFYTFVVILYKQKLMGNTCFLSTAYWPPIQYLTKLVLFQNVFIEAFETYPKQTYRNRLIVYGANGVQSLQIPVVKGSFKNILLKDIEIAYTDNWQKNHFKSIESAYRSSPFYEYYIDDVLPFYENRYKYLIDFNQQILENTLSILGIQVGIQLTSNFELHPNGLDLRNAIHPKSDKQTNDPFFKPKEYVQGFEQRHGFIANLSILDLIFNEGPEAIKLLKQSIMV